MNQITVNDVLQKKKKNQKITALTAYDFAFAKLVDESQIDIILIGDSVGMVALGYENTLSVTMNDMLHHLKAVRKAVKRSLLVIDMPYRSYETAAKTVQNVKKFMDAGAEAVKLEGGKAVLKQVRKLVAQKIPVMGHLGMTPQSINEIGGYKVQGRTQKEADQIAKDAEALEEAGVFSIVLECVPNSLARRVTKQVSVPTIGIGAGPDTDGQILVLYDLLGIESSVRPRFVRRYAAFDQQVRNAVSQYRKDVLEKKFPNLKESFNG